jgi:hypothetical protein
MTVFPIVYRGAELDPGVVTNTSLRSKEQEYTVKGDK